MRIAAIGDSFTYGWAVAPEESWPKRLEHRLGSGFEVANLGIAGGDPALYVRIAQRAIPRLRPDIVLLGILQGDDPVQTLQDPPAAISSTPRRLVRLLANKLTPRLLPLLRGDRKPVHTSAEELRLHWSAQARETLGSSRASRPDKEAEQLLIDGTLNPWLSWCSMRVPEYYALSLDPLEPRLRSLSADLAEHIADVRTIAERNGARLVVVVVPHGMYVNKRALRGIARLGFKWSESMLVSDNPERIICDAAGSNTCLSLVDAFRARQTDDGLFYELDGHFTAKGHDLAAEALYSELKAARIIP